MKQREEVKIDSITETNLINNEDNKNIKNQSNEIFPESTNEIEETYIKIKNLNLDSIIIFLNDCDSCIGNLIKKFNELVIDLSRVEQEAIVNLKQDIFTIISSTDLSNSSIAKLNLYFKSIYKMRKMINI